MSETNPPNSRWSKVPLWLAALLNGMVTIVLIVLTWFLFSSEMGEPFRQNTGSGYKIAIAVLAGLLTGFITLWAIGGDLRKKWTDLAKSTVEIAPTLLRPVLFVLLVIVLTVAYRVMVDASRAEAGLVPAPDEIDFFHLGLVGLTALPSVLTACVSLLIERRIAARGVFSFAVDKSRLSEDLRDSELPEQLQRNWDYERELMQGSIQRMGRHGAILGFLASAIVATCAVTIIRRDNEMNHLVALAVGTAASISFTLHLGQIFFRSASNDATARMMAWASRTLLIVSVCALFFGALALGSDGKLSILAKNPATATAEDPSAPPPETVPAPTTPPPEPNPLRGRMGALLIGVAVALLGERLMRVVTNRAASLLGMEGLAAPQPGNLTLIDGLSEDDSRRLAEERIDSVHALAFTPTPRIFFNTVYSLQRICDWQDQALLIERVGRTNALLLREQFFVRGAISARRYALQKFGPKSQDEQCPAAPPSPSAPKPGIEGDKEPEEPLEPPFDLGQGSHLHHALRSLVDDEDIERLEIFWRAVPILTPEDTKPKTA
ncbi:hypothetical protein [Hyalangium rubrum]|uniref:Uncharacterized protein n=1 Tax=Hyalangium rubrum TaxID=3103134 RepID=A0ABU5HGH2_9BACT|nr:hypothetical protein [Hyalangium sp. s54d21]MDY7231959.1 hypothetical protein [Hyalangium sp. s54d21]